MAIEGRRGNKKSSLTDAKEYIEKVGIEVANQEEPVDKAETIMKSDSSKTIRKKKALIADVAVPSGSKDDKKIHETDGKRKWNVFSDIIGEGIKVQKAHKAQGYGQFQKAGSAKGDGTEIVNFKSNK